ncbi:MAG: methyl-accepting chemotaxis protein, partial [Oscillospiraceae bacterium]|nr:methyl-accepting chemotaxis protein [Oscillospiraceae bacterium]
SAQQINDIVKTIQDFVEKAVEKVSETTSIVQEQEDAVNHSEGIFVEIINAVQTLSKEVNDITLKINNVNQMKTEIQEEVEGLSAIFEETASGAEEVATYSSNIKSSSSQFVTVISRLNDLADELQTHINHFKGDVAK